MWTTHEHELVYVMDDCIRIVDMRKAAHDGNLIEEMPFGAAHSELIELSMPLVQTILSDTYAVVWSLEYMDTFVWDRSSGQRVRVLPGTGARSPCLRDTFLIIPGSDPDDTLVMYDLSLPGDSAPIRQFEGVGKARLQGTTLIQLANFSDEVYEVHAVDINTGEQAWSVIYLPRYSDDVYLDDFFFGITGMIFEMDVNNRFYSSKYRIMCQEFNCIALASWVFSPNDAPERRIAYGLEDEKLCCIYSIVLSAQVRPTY